MRDFLSVFTSSFKQCWRDRLQMIIMVIFPIIIIFILGNALGGFIEGNQDLGGERFSIAVLADENSEFSQFLLHEDTSRFLDATFVYDEDEAMQLLQERDVFIIVTEIYGELTVTLPTSTGSNELVALSIIDSYNQIGAAMTIAMLNNGDSVQLASIMQASISIEQAPLGTRTPSGMDFFAITMMVMMMLFAGYNGMELFKKSLFSETGNRMRTTPVSKPALVGGLISAATVISFLQGLSTLAVTWLMYDVYWGPRVGMVLLTLLGLVLFSNAFAIFLLVALKSSNAANAALQTLIFVMTFVSGGFGAAVTFSDTLTRVFRFVPNNLAQTVLFGSAFGGNETRIVTDLTILFLFSAVLLTLSLVIGKRRLA